MKGFIDYVLARGAESSTWKGLVALAVALGVGLSPEQQAAIVSAGLAVIGTIQVFMDNGK